MASLCTPFELLTTTELSTTSRGSSGPTPTAELCIHRMPGADRNSSLRILVANSTSADGNAARRSSASRAPRTSSSGSIAAIRSISTSGMDQTGRS